MDMRTRYVIKGIGKEQTIDSKINISYNQATGKITKVEDKWDGKLPDSSFSNVSIEQLLSPWWYLHYVESWGWRLWSFTWNMWWWQVCATNIDMGWIDARINIMLTILFLFFAGSAEAECCERAKDGWRPEERRGGCCEGQPVDGL